MSTRLLLALTLAALGISTFAEAALPSMVDTATASPFSIDAAISGQDPISLGGGTTTDSGWQMALAAGLEYSTTFSVPFRLEIGYTGITQARINDQGLYRAWDGFRIALLSGYNFSPISVKSLGNLDFTALAGAACIATEYNESPLSFGYMSLVVEPRLLLAIQGLSANDTGPFVAVPLELQFRSSGLSLVPGATFGFRYHIAGN